MKAVHGYGQQVGLFSSRVNVVELRSHAVTGEPLEIILRVNGHSGTFRGVHVIEVGEDEALLEAPDGSRTTVSLRSVLDPTKFQRRWGWMIGRSPNVGKLDAAETFLTFWLSN